MSSGSASIVISASPDTVWSAISDVTRMGEWSPECVSCTWVNGATGPAVGARFEGVNEMRVFGKVIKRWTTTSEVVRSEPGQVFEFVAAELSTWRYELEASGSGTKVTESFQYEATGFSKFLYDGLLRRPAAMTKGMQRTLERIKASVEAASPTATS
jgi:carbon monoxide dehydrogenase subunit G